MYSNNDPEALSIVPSELDSNTFVATLDQYSQSIANLVDNNPSNTDKYLIDIYDDMNKKYNLNIGYDSFRDFITTIGDKDKLTAKFEQILGGKILESVTRRVILKIGITVGNLIERSLTLMEKQSENSYEVTAELVIYIDKAMQWVKELQKMEEKYGVGDADKLLTKTAREINKVNEDNITPEEARKRQGELSNLIQEIASSN